MVQGKTNRGRHTDHPAGCHSIRTNQCPPPPSPYVPLGTTLKVSLSQQSTLRTAHTCLHITVYNCRTQHSTEQFW